MVLDPLSLKENKRKSGFLIQSSMVASLALLVFFGRPFASLSGNVDIRAPMKPLPLTASISSSIAPFSSGLKISFGDPPKDQRVVRLERYLRRHRSPLADYADLIIEESDKYGIPYKMVVAIAYHESGLCRKCFKPYNCWGWMTKDSWESYEEAIPKYIKGLYKGYFSKGVDTIEEIAPTYVMTDNWPNFVSEINDLMLQIP